MGPSLLFASVLFAMAAVTMGFRFCMKVSLRSSWEPRAVCLSLCLAQRSWRTNERWQSGKSQWYICLGLSATRWSASCWTGQVWERRTVQLVPVQMLGARVALAAARVGAFELLVEALPAAPSLARRAGAVWVVAGVGVVLVGVVAVASAASVVVGAIRGSGGVLGAGGGVHFLGKGLEFAKIRALACVHWQDLSSHRGHERGVESWERREARLGRVVSPRASLDPRARLDRAGAGRISTIGGAEAGSTSTAKARWVGRRPGQRWAVTGLGAAVGSWAGLVGWWALGLLGGLLGGSGAPLLGWSGGGWVRVSVRVRPRRARLHLRKAPSTRKAWGRSSRGGEDGGARG